MSDILTLSRRGFLTALAAPAIVSFTSIMPVRAMLLMPDENDLAAILRASLTPRPLPWAWQRGRERLPHFPLTVPFADETSYMRCAPTHGAQSVGDT